MDLIAGFLTWTPSLTWKRGVFPRFSFFTPRYIVCCRVSEIPLFAPKRCE
jgi:hypothetical protein